MFKLPKKPGFIVLTQDVHVDARDLMRFQREGGRIMRNGYRMEIANYQPEHN